MTKQEHLQVLIDEHEKEVMKAEYMVDFYEQEIENPTHLGKAEAEEAATLWTKHIETRKQELERLKAYGKRKNII